MDPSRVLWIGGAPGSGTGDLARALAERFGLALYSLDERSAAHESRLPSRAGAPPGEPLGSFLALARHRFRLVLEDLRAMPDAPLVLVEGPQLLPTSVSAVLSSPERALFVQPAGVEGDGPVAVRYAQEARDLRLTVLSAALPFGELVELAAAAFLPAISAAGGRSP